MYVTIICTIVSRLWQGLLFGARHRGGMHKGGSRSGAEEAEGGVMGEVRETKGETEQKGLK